MLAIDDGLALMNSSAFAGICDSSMLATAFLKSEKRSFSLSPEICMSFRLLPSPSRETLAPLSANTTCWYLLGNTRM